MPKLLVTYGIQTQQVSNMAMPAQHSCEWFLNMQAIMKPRTCTLSGLDVQEYVVDNQSNHGAMNQLSNIIFSSNQARSRPLHCGNLRFSQKIGCW